MIYISYFGNIYDKNIELENNIDYIIEAIHQGYNVLIHIDYIDNNFYLGKNKINIDFLEKNIKKLWFNNLNNSTLIRLNKIFYNINIIDITNDKLYYLPELLKYEFPKRKKNIDIICSSHIGWYKQLYEAKYIYAITINGRFNCHQENLFPKIIKYLNENRDEWIDIHIAINDNKKNIDTYLNDKYMNYPFIASFSCDKWIIPDKYMNYPIFEKVYSINKRNLISSFYTNKLISKQLLSSQINYNLVMKYRPDIINNDDLPNLKSFLSLVNNNNIFVPSIRNYGFQGYNINDQICITDNNLIHKYLNVYDYIDKYIIEDNIVLQSETLLHYHLKKNNIQIERFNYEYDLNSNRSKKLLIEVGSYDGSDSLKFYNDGYIVYTFEPNKDLYNQLAEKTKNLPNYNVINKAIYTNNEIKKFNICKKGGASSILEFKSNDELIKHWSSDRDDIQYSGISYDVETIRLDTFIEDNDIENTLIDYIHIEAQGVDLECLMSLGKYIKNVKEGVIETVIDNDKSIYLNQYNNFNNVKKFLEENNFIIRNIISNDSTNCEYNVYFKSKFFLELSELYKLNIIKYK